VVDNLPHATFKGEDAQLAAAVKLLKQKIKDTGSAAAGAAVPKKRLLVERGCP